MTHFAALIRWEVDQMWRGTGLRMLLVAAFLLSLASSVLGQTQVFDVTLPRNSTPVLWGTFIAVTTLLGLVVLIVTTEFLLRDRRDRIEEVLATAPLNNGAYALAKYLVAAGGALLLAITVLVALLCVQVVLHLTGSHDYPTLWFGRYAHLWLLLLVPAALFASAASFLGTYVFGKNRLILYALFFVLWLVPLITGSTVQSYPDLTGQQFMRDHATPYYERVERTYIVAAGGPRPGQPHDQQPTSFSLLPQADALIAAVNTWPPDMSDLMTTRLEELGAACILVLGGIWRFQRFHTESAKTS